MAEEFNWDLTTQGAILSSFYIGYLLMQIGGGHLADRFGGKIVLGLGVLIWSLFTIITPWAAFMGLFALYAARIGMGLGEAVTFPSVYSLVTRWFGSGEKSKAIALNASGSYRYRFRSDRHAGYRRIPWLGVGLYLLGIVGVFWMSRRRRTTTPDEHPRISDEEAMARG